jgi:lambda family phage minor tail protein L
MRIINSTFTQEKNKAVNSPLFLYTIYNYNGLDDDLNFARWDTDIVYGGVTYTKFPITHEKISENTSGEVDTVQIRISNVNRLIQSFLEDYSWSGKKIIIKQVWADHLDDAEAYIMHEYYIDSYSTNEMEAVFTLTSKFDVLDIVLPGGTYNRNYCRWKFKSSECGYSGAETTCNKTLQRCRELGNQERIGAFPAVPLRKLLLG